MKQVIFCCALVIGGGVAPGVSNAQGDAGFHGTYGGTIDSSGCAGAHTECTSDWTGAGPAAWPGPSSFSFSRNHSAPDLCDDFLDYYGMVNLASTTHGAAVTLLVHSSASTNCEPEQGTWIAAAPASGSGTYVCSYDPSGVTAVEPFTCTFDGRLSRDTSK